MTFLPSRHSHHGYYDKNGHWKRTKYCFIPCGPDKCDCGPPNGIWFLELSSDKIVKEENKNETGKS